MGLAIAKVLRWPRLRLTAVPIMAFALSYGTPALASSADVVRAIKATSNVEAAFVHRFTPKGFRHEQVEQGVVLFGELPKMRWTYEDPEEKIFVFDGSTSWFYIPDDKQVTIHSLSQEERSELPFVVLGDEQSVAINYRVSSQQNDRGTLLVLDPVTPGAMLRSIEIEVDARHGWIRRLSYADREGNRTVFEVTGQRRVEPLRDSFRFDPPEGVDIIDDQERD